MELVGSHERLKNLNDNRAPELPRFVLPLSG